MKNLLISVLTVLFAFYAFPQSGKSNLTKEQIDSIRKYDMDQFLNEDTVRVFDSLCQCDYIERHIYPNGQLHYEVTVVNGRQIGLREQYHPNGEFHGRKIVGCDFCSCNPQVVFWYDRFGDVSSFEFCLEYASKTYYFQTINPGDDLVYLFIHRIDTANPQSYHSRFTIAAEFARWKGKWEKHPFHGGDWAKCPKRLLRLYLLECKRRELDF